MSTTKIRDVVEVVRILSIVSSLIFVGIQLRLEQKVALGASYQERAES